MTGSFTLRGSGDARFESARLRGDVEASAQIERLDLGRGVVHLRRLDVVTRDLAVLAGEGTLPGWTSSIFPMNELTASGDLRLSRDKLDLDLRARASSALVTARLHDIGEAMSGAVKVETQLASVGIAFEAGQSHVKIFAGEDWLNARIAEVTAKESADRAGVPAAATP